MFKKISLALPLALALAAISMPTQAAIVNFSSTLDGAQANSGMGTGSPGVGSATVTLDDVTGAITLTGTFSGLLEPATNAHIHIGAPGVSGGTLVQMTFTNATSGVIGVASNATLPLGNIQDMLDGLTYINIHSSRFTAGEIRGQLLINAVPEPSSALLLGFGSAFAFLRRRRV